MHKTLKDILLQKKLEVAALKDLIQKEPDGELARYFEGEFLTRRIKSLKQSLAKPTLGVIAEIKRASPAKGALADIVDPILLATKYQAGGAAAISVLTDELFFKGSPQDLQQVSAALAQTPCPILRKDFIIDEIQIAQAAKDGADAVLLIVAVLEDKTYELLDYAAHLGLEVLLEVHTKDELLFALETDAEIIGINNRNLHDFSVDVQRSLDLVQIIPSDMIAVAESGIHDADCAQRLFHAGFDAVLVGEALVKSNDPEEFIAAMQGLNNED